MHGAGLERAVEPAEQVGQQLLAAHAHVGEPGGVRVALEVGGGERVDVDHRPRARGRRAAGRWRRSPRRARAPAAARAARRPARRASARPRSGRRSATARPRTAARRRGAARAGTPRTSARARAGGAAPRGRARGRTLASSNGSAAASHDGRLDVEPEPLGVAAQRVEHAGRDVGADRRADDAVLHQVEREVARCPEPISSERANGPGRRPSSFSTLPSTCARPTVAEVDAPLRVVVGGRDVVVAAVDVEDLVGGVGRGHAGRKSRSRGSSHARRRARTRRGSRGR